MKRLVLIALAVGLVVAGLGYADEFTGYPDDLQIWTGRTTQRVRGDGVLDVEGTMVLRPNPSSAFVLQTGVVFFDSTDNKLKYFDGSEVKEISVE